LKFYSTNRNSPEVPLADAVLRGLAEDGGLYMPAEIPVLSPEFFAALGGMSFQEITFEVGRKLIGAEVPPDKLQAIVRDAFDFPAPLVRLDECVHVLELFHGPTLAFKDFGARFMARLMGHFVAGDDGARRANAQADRHELLVLVATSGDTGGAVAHGFFGVSGIRVVVLYPSGQVSEVQEKQLTTLGGNVTAVEVAGSFDDCQRLVKLALSDPGLRRHRRLTTANSINIARLLPQVFYYFHGFARLAGSGPAKKSQVVFSVPSGNFGNLTAGLLARRMGLPIAKFIAATNINDAVRRYLETGEFKPGPSLRTISNAMDVGDPSNFARLLELCGRAPHERLKKMREDIWGSRHSDQETEQAIARCWREHRYLLDPHTAVGWLGLQAFFRGHSAPSQGIVLGTAHPAKLATIVERAGGVNVPIPARIRETLSSEKAAVSTGTDYPVLRSMLLAL
jgi:threonine synthase